MALKTLAHWTTTGLVGVGFPAGGTADLARAPDLRARITRFGYPPYFAMILGAWKLLGAAAVLVPLVLLAIIIASWALRPASRTLAQSDRLAAMSRDPIPAARTGGLP